MRAIAERGRAVRCRLTLCSTAAIKHTRNLSNYAHASHTTADGAMACELTVIAEDFCNVRQRNLRLAHCRNCHRLSAFPIPFAFAFAL